MTFQDTANSASQGQEQVQDTPPELAVFNLESTRSPADLQRIANQVQLFLSSCGQTNLQQLQAYANIPMVANSFALTGSVLDVILFALKPKQGDAGVQQAALLSANLIGLFLAPQSEAHVRMALRPMFGLMAEYLYKEDGKIQEPGIKRLSLHLNAMIAGDLEKFLKENKGKLAGLLSSASALGGSMMTALSMPKGSIQVR